MAEAATAPHPAVAGEAAIPSASPRPSPMKNPNSIPAYHPPASGYGPYPGAPTPHMGSPNHNAPPPYPMYPVYPPMNGPPTDNYGPPPSPHHQQHSSPEKGSSGHPPHYNMYPMPYAYPPNWNGQGGMDSYWGMPPPPPHPHSGENGNECPSRDAREESAKDGEIGQEVEQKPTG